MRTASSEMAIRQQVKMLGKLRYEKNKLLLRGINMYEQEIACKQAAFQIHCGQDGGGASFEDREIRGD